MSSNRLKRYFCISKTEEIKKTRGGTLKIRHCCAKSCKKKARDYIIHVCDTRFVWLICRFLLDSIRLLHCRWKLKSSFLSPFLFALPTTPQWRHNNQLFSCVTCDWRRPQRRRRRLFIPSSFAGKWFHGDFSGNNMQCQQTYPFF